MTPPGKYFVLVGLGGLLFAHRLLGQAAGNDNPGGVTAEYYGSSEVAGHYDPYTGNGKREIDDIVVTGSVGMYPLKFTRILHTRGSSGGSGRFGEGGGWSHCYVGGFSTRPPNSYANADHEGLYEGPLGHVTYPGGGEFDLWEEGPTWAIDANGPHSLPDVMVDCSQVSGCTSGTAFELRRIDGSKLLFAGPPTSSAHRLYSIIDPFGQPTTLTYDNSGRLWKVTEPGGRFLELFYQTFSYWAQTNPPMLASQDLISMVTGNDGQGNVTETVTYEYDWVTISNGALNSRSYNLRTVSYDDGAQASYTYAAANTNWSGNGINHEFSPVVHTCDDPRYAGPMKQIEFEYVRGLEVAGVGYGQLKSEKNVFGQVVAQASYILYPATAADRLKRTETRGDGPSRTFNYLAAADAYEWSRTWTDFKNHMWTETTSYTTSLYGWKITDPRQNTTTYERNPSSGVLQKIIFPRTDPDPTPATIEFTYSDPAKPYYLSGKKDENDHWTYYDREEQNPVTHRVTRIRYPDGSTEEFSYNNLGQVLTHKLRSGGRENFRYDTRGLKTLSWPPATESDPNPEQHPTTYTYYQAADGHPAWIDRLKSVTDPRGNATWFEYNQRGQITKVTHQDGYFSQSEYNTDGTVKWTADENHPNAALPGHENERTRYFYDEYKRVLTVTNPMGQVTTNSYGLNPITWGDPLLHTTNTIKYTLSPMGKNVVYDYDENFRKKDQAVALGTADEAWTFFDYDEVGNLTRTQDPRGNVTTFGYDERNRKIWMNDPIPTDRNLSGHTMNWVYDGVGNKLKETRADDAFRSWEYDSVNRLNHAIDWRLNSSDPPVTTTYSRDLPNDRTEWITDAKGAIYTLNFDALHRKISETYPVDALGQTRTETWHYDAAGNLDQYHNPANQTKYLNYDNCNRVWDTWWAGGAGPLVSTRYDPAGRVTSITTNGGETSIAFGYDGANRKTWEDQTTSAGTRHWVQGDRDPDGNQGFTFVPGATLVYYRYTQRNQLARIDDENGTPWFYFAYDAKGNLTNRQGVKWGYTDSLNVPGQWYDPLDRPVMWENTKSQEAFLGRSWYQYDKVGREVATWRDEEGSKGERFDYNVRSQVTKAIYKADQVWTGNPQPPADGAEDFGVTALNRESMTRNGTTTAYTTSQLNQYTHVGGQALQYDDNFNLKTYGGAIFTFDAENRLMSANQGTDSLQFVYDGLGRCVLRTVNGVTTAIAYDGWKPVVERDLSGNLKAVNIYGAGPDEILWRSVAGVGDFRYHHDARGNVMYVLDGAGYLAEKYSYDAFGKPKIMDWNGNERSESAIQNRFLFQGREWIPELGIYDNRHRMYQPELGRFLQTDPTGLQAEGAKLTPEQKALYGAGAPEAFGSSEMNLYRYCGDDPVDRSDSMGLDPSALEWWKQAGTIKIERTGNWGDRTRPDFYQDGLIVRGEPAEGKTVQRLKRLVAQPDGAVTGELYVDTHVLPSHRDDLVDQREQEHPEGYKKMLQNLSDDVLNLMMHDQQKYESMKQFAEARKEYVQKVYENETAKQRVWERKGDRHDYNGPEFKKKN